MNPAELNYQAVSTFDGSSEQRPLADGQRGRRSSSQQCSRMEKGKKYRQFLAGVLVNLSSVAVGTTLGWPSPEAAFLNSHGTDNPIGRPVTENEMSWVGSLVAMGALIAPFVAGVLAEKIGRKYTLLASSAFFIVSFVLLGTAASIGQILAARLLQGFGVGFVMTVQSMYVGEISTDDSRGALGSFMQLFIVVGILFVNCVGPYNSYVMTQWICLVVPVVFAITFWFMPETPYYYMGKGKREEAAKSLAYLRGKSVAGVKEEIEGIEESVQEAMKEKGRFIDLFINKGNLKALIISTGLISFQQLSGINAILFYTKTIFEKTGSSLDPAIATILVCIVQVVASGATPLIVDRLGRKLILLVSAGGMSLSLAVFGVYFYLGSIKSEAVPNLGWLPVTALIAFVAVYCVGFGPLPWAVLGEMFPSNVKSIASSVVASTCWILGFLVAKYYTAMDQALGSHWAFWIFGICCAAAFTFTLTIVFETKGMSLKQIQDKLNGRSQ